MHNIPGQYHIILYSITSIVHVCVLFSMFNGSAQTKRKDSMKCILVRDFKIMEHFSPVSEENSHMTA